MSVCNCGGSGCYCRWDRSGGATRSFLLSLFLGRSEVGGRGGGGASAVVSCQMELLVPVAGVIVAASA